MEYKYSLTIEAFQSDDNEKCLAEIMHDTPDIGEEMKIKSGFIIFDPTEVTSTWRNADEIAVPIIKNHIKPGTTCTITWQGEDGIIGGTLIGSGRSFDVIYEPMVVTKEGIMISLDKAKLLLEAANDKNI